MIELYHVKNVLQCACKEFFMDLQFVQANRFMGHGWLLIQTKRTTEKDEMKVDSSAVLMHFVETLRAGCNDLEEQAYCFNAARRWAAWIIAGEA